MGERKERIAGMQVLEFWKRVTMDRAGFLEQFFDLLDRHCVRYAVVGGQAVNAYVEPLVSLDLDLAIAAEQLPEVERLLAERFTVKRFPHSLNVLQESSDLRVQIQTDPRYGAFVGRAERREVLGMSLQVASLADTLQGKVWAAQDEARRGSKRQKDLADIARILESHPDLGSSVPREVLDRLVR